MRALLPAGALLTLIAAGCATGAVQAPAPSTEAVERIVHDYLVKHPEVVADALRALEERKRAAERVRAREAILARQQELLRDPSAPLAGNPQGDVTLVEFLDYN